MDKRCGNGHENHGNQKVARDATREFYGKDLWMERKPTTGCGVMKEGMKKGIYRNAH